MHSLGWSRNNEEFLIYSVSQGDNVSTHSSNMRQSVSSCYSLPIFSCCLPIPTPLSTCSLDHLPRLGLPLQTKMARVQSKRVSLKNPTDLIIWSYRWVNWEQGCMSYKFSCVCVLCRCVMEKGVLQKLWSLLQWSIFSFAALGMFAISLVRIHST